MDDDDLHMCDRCETCARRVNLVEDLRAAVARVRGMHKADREGRSCDWCLNFWPCPTIRTLDGEERGDPIEYP